MISLKYSNRQKNMRLGGLHWGERTRPILTDSPLTFTWYSHTAATQNAWLFIYEGPPLGVCFCFENTGAAGKRWWSFVHAAITSKPFLLTLWQWLYKKVCQNDFRNKTKAFLFRICSKGKMSERGHLSTFTISLGRVNNKAGVSTCTSF